MMQGLKKIRTGTGEIYRYPDVRVTASAVASGDAAFFWYEVYSGLARITLHVIQSWVLLNP
jgi:hypothetical protein